MGLWYNDPMKKKRQGRAIIIYGPPGAGKGTQAELLSRLFQFVHFDTGRYLEHLYRSPAAKTDPILKREKKIFDTGVLNTPSFVLAIVSDATRRMARAGLDIAYSGSPRTLYEAFGDDRREGLMHVLIKEYGKKNIAIIELDVPPKESTRRNGARYVCSICGLPRLAEAKGKRCAFCAGPLRRRSLDAPSVMATRLKEYKERTEPIFARMKKEKFRMHRLNGVGDPYRVFERVEKTLRLRA